MGSLYRRGSVWWHKYYVAGRPVRVSTETTKEKEARDFLKNREGRVVAGEPVLPRAGRVRYEEARNGLTGGWGRPQGNRSGCAHRPRGQHGCPSGDTPEPEAALDES